MWSFDHNVHQSHDQKVATTNATFRLRLLFGQSAHTHWEANAYQRVPTEFTFKQKTSAVPFLYIVLTN